MAREMMALTGPWCSQDPPLTSVGAAERFPIRFEPFGGRFYVTGVQSGQGVLLGGELIAIDGKPVEELRNRLSTLSGGVPGHRDLAVAERLSGAVELHALGLTRRRQTATFVIRTQTGAMVSQYLSASTDGPDREIVARLPFRDRTPWALREPDLKFRLLDRPASDALLVQLRQMLDAEVTLASFVERANAERRRLGRNNLIIDLRSNAGGNFLLSRDAFATWPAEVPGTIVVLTGPRTFSAAIVSLAYLKQAGGDQVVVVGEPAGDQLEFFSDGLPIRLPGSGAYVLPAIARVDLRTGCRDRNDCTEALARPGARVAPSVWPSGRLRRSPVSIASLEPDIVIIQTISDLVDGRDRVLEAAENVLCERRSSPSATRDCDRIAPPTATEHSPPA